MQRRTSWILPLAVVLAIAGCGGTGTGTGSSTAVPAVPAGAETAAGAAPDAASLRDAFAERIASSTFVREFDRNGDELRLLGPDGAGGEGRWRIQIDEATVEPYDDDATPYMGAITASWFVNDQPVRPEGAESYLPVEFLDRGVAQECWALWDPSAGAWGW
jgi:hypothetical protein